MSSVVCRLFVVCLSVRLWRECIVTKWLKRGSCSFHYNVAQRISSLPAKFNNEIRKGPLDRGLELGWVVFDLAMHAISWKRCEMEPTWQLITNSKSYTGFRLQQSWWPWMTLNVNLLLGSQRYACSNWTQACYKTKHHGDKYLMSTFSNKQRSLGGLKNVKDVDELLHHIADEPYELDQRVVNRAVGEWWKRLWAFVAAGGGQLEHKTWTFVSCNAEFH